MMIIFGNSPLKGEGRICLCKNHAFAFPFPGLLSVAGYHQFRGGERLGGDTFSQRMDALVNRFLHFTSNFLRHSVLFTIPFLGIFLIFFVCF